MGQNPVTQILIQSLPASPRHHQLRNLPESFESQIDPFRKKVSRLQSARFWSRRFRRRRKSAPCYPANCHSRNAWVALAKLAAHHTSSFTNTLSFRDGLVGNWSNTACGTSASASVFGIA